MFDIVEATRFFSVRSTVYNLSTVPQLVAGNEPQRVALYFTCGSGSPALLLLSPNHSFSSPDAICPTNGMFRLTWPLDGVMTTLPWYAGQTGVGNPLTVVEMWFRPPKGQY